MADPIAVPPAHGSPIGSARLRAVPEDFIVREWLGFSADGEGDHWLLTVRKRDANTHWVAKQLAKLAQVHPREVGYAGLKDRHAVCEQAFSLPVRSAMQGSWEGVSGDGFEVVGAQRHRRKLKPGALQGNDFTIVLREFSGDAALIETRMAAIAAQGVPNYFGPQRFGIDGSNLERARAWFAGHGELRDHLQRGLAFSAARSALFNAVLAARVREGTWNRLQAGDVANLDGSQSIFAVAELDATLTARCEQFDIHPTGPLPGRGESKVQGAPATLEAQVLNEQQSLVDGLMRAGVDQQRRALRVRPSQLEWQWLDDKLEVRFRLRRGAFATSVLHELLDNAFAQPLAEGVEE